MTDSGRGYGGDLSEDYELLDQIVRNYGPMATSADWWLNVGSADLRMIQVTMACEDILGVDDQPRYIAEVLARTVAGHYGF